MGRNEIELLIHDHFPLVLAAVNSGTSIIKAVTVVKANWKVAVHLLQIQMDSSMKIVDSQHYRYLGIS